MVNVLPTMNPNYFLFFYLPIAHHFPDYNYIVFFFFSVKWVDIFLTRILIGFWYCVFLLDVNRSHSSQGGMAEKCFSFCVVVTHNGSASAYTLQQ